MPGAHWILNKYLMNLYNGYVYWMEFGGNLVWSSHFTNKTESRGTKQNKTMLSLRHTHNVMLTGLNKSRFSLNTKNNHIYIYLLIFYNDNVFIVELF